VEFCKEICVALHINQQIGKGVYNTESDFTPESMQHH
jgi:exoribonuclease II